MRAWQRSKGKNYSSVNTNQNLWLVTLEGHMHVVVTHISVMDMMHRTYLLVITVLFSSSGLRALCSPEGSAAKEKFVIFVREEGTGGWDDMTSTAWEFDPSRPDALIERKHVFAKSHWSLSLFFLDSGPDLKSLVRIQINDSARPDGFFVRLYKVNYTDWSAKLILEANQIQPLGHAGGSAYVGTPEGKMRIDLGTAKTTSLNLHFSQLCNLGKTWIIHIDDSPKNRAQVFDVQAGEPTVSFNLPESYRRTFYAETSPTGGFAAICNDVDSQKMISGFGLPAKSLPTDIVLVDTRTGTTTILPVNIYSCPGSGVPNLAPGFGAWFPDDERFEYISAIKQDHVIEKPLTTEMAKSLLELVSVDLKSGHASRQPFDGRYPDKKRNRRIWIPEYLEQERTKIRDQNDLAHAFLKHLRLEYDVPSAWSDTCVGFSDDGRRFLLKMTSSAESKDFLYGDLEAQTYRRIPSPEALKRVNGLNIVAVSRAE
jgi:hypothetical protein